MEGVPCLLCARERRISCIETQVQVLKTSGFGQTHLHVTAGEVGCAGQHIDNPTCFGLK